MTLCHWIAMAGGVFAGARLVDGVKLVAWAAGLV